MCLPSLSLDGTHLPLQWMNGFYSRDQDAGLDLVRSIQKIRLCLPPVMCRNLPCSRWEEA
jgi:hypothetical protein